MKPKEMQRISIQKFLEEAQNEAQKLSDRDLLGQDIWNRGVA